MARRVPALLLAVSLAGCVLPPNAGTGPAAGLSALQAPAAWAMGEVHAAGPLAGATVKVYDPAGKLLLEALKPTTANGTFAFDAPALVGQPIRVVATGGVVNGQPFKGTLEAGFDAWDPRRDLMYLHPAATVAVAHQRKRGGTMAAAVAATNRYLGLPPSMARGTDHGNPFQRHFGEELFMQAAGGDLTGHVGRVADEVAAGGTTSRYRRSARYQVQQSAGTAIFNAAKSFAGSTAGKAIGGAIVGAAVNYVIAAAGLDPATNQRKEMIAKLDELSSKIDGMASELHDVSNQVADLRTDVDAKINALNQADFRRTAQASYTAGTQQLAAPTAAVDTMWDTYELICKHHDDMFSSIVAFAKYDGERLKADLATIDNVGVGQLQGEALVDQWARYVGVRWQANGKYPYVVGKAYFQDYFSTPDELAMYQVRGALLYEELLRAQADPAVKALLQADRQGQPLPTTLPSTDPLAAPTPSAVTQFQATITSRLANEQAKLWCGDLVPGAADSVLGSPLKGLLYSRAPMPTNVKYNNMFFSGMFFGETLTHMGVWDGNLTPAPASLPLAAYAPGGQAGSWRWPTPAELSALAPTNAGLGMKGLTAAGFDFSNVPHYVDGLVKPTTGKTDQLLLPFPYGIWSSGYQADEPMAVSVVEQTDPATNGAPLYTYASYGPAALLFLPVLPVKVDKVAAEFGQKL